MGILSGIGNGIDDIWQYLINDPTKPSGGILQQALNPQAAVAASTKTPLGAPSQAPGAPPVAPSSSLLSYFQPHSGILGNSPLAAALSGGLAGLGSSTGYTGLAAVGQGFGGGTRAAQERQFNQIQPILAGQQYQQGQQQQQLGQQQLVGGNIANQFALERLNSIRSYFDPSAPPLTMEQLLADPSLANSATGGLNIATPQGGTPTGASQAPTQPTSSAAGMIPPPPSPGMQQPVVGGQPSLGQSPNNPQVTASMPTGGAVPGYPVSSAAPTQAASSGGQPAPAGTQLPPAQSAEPTPDPTAADPYAGMQRAQDFAMAMGNYNGAAEMGFKIEQAKRAAAQAADVAKATKTVEDQSLGASSTRLQALRDAYAKDHAVSTYADVKPNYQAIVAQYAEGKTAKGGLPSDIDFLNGVIKMMNPNASNLRPGTTEALEEAKGFGSYIQKGYQAIVGGTGLTPEIRETLMNIAKQHMKAYQTAYDTSVKNFRKNASMVAPGVDEGAWRTDATDQPPAAAVDALKKNPALAEQFENKYGAGSSLPYVQE